MENNVALKNRIMRRAYTIWGLRKITSPRVVKFLILIAAFWQIKDHVFVTRVFQNMPSLANFYASYNFFYSALLHTQLIVQISILTSTVVAMLLMKDFLQRKEATYWF